MELIIELFVIGCGLLVWCFLMLGWLVYISKRKPSKSVCVIGTCLLIAPVILVLGGFANGLRLDTQESDFFNAANHGDNAQVEQLIRSGADINHEVDNFNMTPLMAASWGGHADTVALLLRHHPDVNHTNRDGDTALQLAMESQYPEVVHLLKAAGAKMQESLTTAALEGDPASVERFIKAGADINREQGFWHFTPLMCAVSNGHTQTVKAILGHHPDVNHTNFEGKTALQIANEQETKHPDIIRLLKAAGANK
jgi:ankyrin repeat protein